MNSNSTIDFSNYPDDALEKSLLQINREKFEQNYLACLAEIKKRKDEGRWTVSIAKGKTKKKIQIKKWIRMYALVQSVFAGLGIVFYLISYGPQVLSGQKPFIISIVIFGMLLLLGITAWGAGRYWKTESDKKGLWRACLCLQVFSFQMNGYVFIFRPGFSILGELKTAPGTFNFGPSLKFSSNPSFYWNQTELPFYLAVNVLALFVLYYLKRGSDPVEQSGDK